MHMNITHVCGHTTYERIGRRTPEQAATYICGDCDAAKTAAYNAERLEKAQKHAVEQNLPVLEGSEKQVAWAFLIRYDIAETLTWLRRRMQEKGVYFTGTILLDTDEAKLEASKELKQIRQLCYRQKNAAWWIQYREMSPESLYSKLKSEWKAVKAARVAAEAK